MPLTLPSATHHSCQRLLDSYPTIDDVYGFQALACIVSWCYKRPRRFLLVLFGQVSKRISHFKLSLPAPIFISKQQPSDFSSPIQTKMSNSHPDPALDPYTNGSSTLSTYQYGSEKYTSDVSVSRQQHAESYRGIAEPLSGMGFLACPFSRHSEHPGCYYVSSNLQDIESLVEHLQEYHTQPPYCPICQATFVSDELCNDHINARRCLSQAPAPKQVILGQFRLIYELRYMIERLNTSVSPGVQWYIIWSIIFPGQEPTRGPYNYVHPSESSA